MARVGTLKRAGSKLQPPLGFFWICDRIWLTDPIRLCQATTDLTLVVWDCDANSKSITTRGISRRNGLAGLPLVLSASVVCCFFGLSVPVILPEFTLKGGNAAGKGAIG